MGYKTIPSVNNYTPSGIVIQLIPHFPTIYDMSVEGDCNGPYEGSSKIPYYSLKSYYRSPKGDSHAFILSNPFFANILI
jgi:hypothetical protein